MGHPIVRRSFLIVFGLCFCAWVCARTWGYNGEQAQPFPDPRPASFKEPSVLPGTQTLKQSTSVWCGGCKWLDSVWCSNCSGRERSQGLRAAWTGAPVLASRSGRDS